MGGRFESVSNFGRYWSVLMCSVQNREVGLWRLWVQVEGTMSLTGSEN